jgi:cytochrome c-type biogenesis protein CcmH/NrfG
MGDQDIHRRVVPRAAPGASVAVPDPLPLQRALNQCEPLQRLQQRLAQSGARMEAVRPLLPAALLRHVRSGPSDDEGWTMLAGNPAVAAKLRQLQPRLEAALKQKGFQRTGIRIRVQSPTNP